MKQANLRGRAFKIAERLNLRFKDVVSGIRAAVVMMLTFAAGVLDCKGKRTAAGVSLALAFFIIFCIGGKTLRFSNRGRNGR